jgi:hypothetical protein
VTPPRSSLYHRTQCSARSSATSLRNTSRLGVSLGQTISFQGLVGQQMRLLRQLNLLLRNSMWLRMGESTPRLGNYRRRAIPLVPCFSQARRYL